MGRPIYHETACKTALNRVRGMPFAWSLNPYRGCVHDCHCCCARATHAYVGMNAGADCSTPIVVKTNLPEVLRAELARPAWKRERVAIGTATDGDRPCEGRCRLTRRALAARFPALLARYERAYQDAGTRLDYLVAMERWVAVVRERQGFATDAMADRRVAVPAAQGCREAPAQLRLALR